MQNYCKTIGALAAASALVAGNASAEVEYEIHTGYSNEYIFRGIDLGNDLTEFGLDAATEVNGWGLSAGLWATAFDQSFTPDQIDSETDLYAEVSKDLGFATAAVGYIYYWNLGSTSGGTDDQEVYFQLSRDFGFATGSVTYFWDMVENNGGNDGYTELALSRSWELNPCLTLNVGTNVGLLTESGCDHFTAWTTKCSLDWGFVENAKLSPFIALAIALGENGNGNTWGQTDNEFVAGSMLSVSF